MQGPMKHFLLSLLCLLTVASTAADKKQLTAKRTSTAPKIDGVLNEEAWQTAEPAGDFVQRAPKPGQPSKFTSEVKILYDDVAIYVGAMLYDSNPDSILHELSQRDNEANADAFGLFLDTYNDDINAYGFFVTAAGVQLDARYSSQGQDLNWNAVWQSQVRITDKGWVVEFRIPYSALRFPNVAEQKFGLNIIRKVRRTREDAFWNEIKPEADGLVNQSGDLNGISDIKSPLRLSVTPYVSAYLENYPYDLPGKSNNTYSLNGGMDIKYGINESFTLDMTLVPDFGQVQSDNKVLNLSPFEVQYDENRQFFTEGTELFNKGGLFYSRRVGGVPLDYYAPYAELKEGEYVKENPGSTQLINATKVSGRTRTNLGIGVFNATSANTYAVISDSSGNTRKVLTQPLTNYNVLVFDQALKNNSYISLINTNVTREGKAYDANVTGTEFKFANRKNTFAVNGNGAVSQLYFSDSSKPVLGYVYALRAGKISGKLTYSISANVKSDTYDPNDLGISFMNNTIETYVNAGYNIFTPFWRLNDFSVSGGVGYSRLYHPGFLWNFNIFGEAYTTFTRSFLSTGAGFNFEPIVTYDHWEPRVKGHYYAYPKDYLGYYWFSSDYRKRFALDGRVNYRYFEENSRYTISFGLDPRFRVNNKLSFIYSYNREYQNDDIGFVNYDETSDVITFGRRSVLTITNQLNINYIFTNKMSLSLRGRHYWSKAEYKQYYTLSDKGLLFDDNQYPGNSNVNFNAFNIDLVYKWQFSPGSEVSFVWKNAIYTYGSQVIEHFSDDVDETFRSPQFNSFSIKLLYYLDYSMLKRKRKV
ncbi:MAG: carbohydrate binding family 9 protein [Bacteroidetes bacterium]|nr:carbohydrate binding family 9 protein [Bacteroidota bacterium]